MATLPLEAVTVTFAEAGLEDRITPIWSSMGIFQGKRLTDSSPHSCRRQKHFRIQTSNRLYLRIVTVTRPDTAVAGTSTMARIPGIRPEIMLRNVHLKGVGMFQNTTVKSVLILAVGAVWLFRGVRAETEKKNMRGLSHSNSRKHRTTTTKHRPPPARFLLHVQGVCAFCCWCCGGGGAFPVGAVQGVCSLVVGMGGVSAVLLLVQGVCLFSLFGPELTVHSLTGLPGFSCRA